MISENMLKSIEEDLRRLISSGQIVPGVMMPTELELCQDFNQFGLYDILAREYQLAITQIQHTITATVADESQAELLQIEAGDPLLVVNTTTFLANHQLFEYTTSYYRADKYEYSTTDAYTS